MKNIVITSSKEVSAITIEGKLFPVDAGKKSKISHPISIPKWMEEGLEKKLFFEGMYETQKIGLTQKGNPKFKIIFKGNMVNPEDYWVFKETIWDSVGWCKKVRKTDVWENKYLGTKSKHEVLPFKECPEEKTFKFKKERFESFIHKVNERLNTIYSIKQVLEAWTRIEQKAIGKFELTYFPKTIEWETNFFYSFYYPKWHKTIVCNHEFYSGREPWDQKKYDAAKFFDIEISEPYNLREEKREYQAIIPIPESDDGWRKEKEIRRKTTGDFNIHNYKVMFKIKEEFKGFFCFDYYEEEYEHSSLK
jgi:hypothetical protein